jgi:hypothetical protein
MAFFAAVRLLCNGADTRGTSLTSTAMTEPNATPAAPGSSQPEALQFDQVDAGTAAPEAAQATALQCASCSNPITTVYYHVDGNPVCSRCRAIAASASLPPKGAGVFFKSFLFGGVAAVVGAAIYYAVIAITNFEIGLVAILIGFLVGAAVRRGTSGRGGRKYQVLALVLTYFAVGLAYTPLAFKGAMDASKANVADSTRSTGADSASAQTAAQTDSLSVALAGSPSSDATQLTMKSALLSLAIVFVGGFFMIFALPVLAVFGSLPSGLISALIIGFGMQQAWKMTGAHVANITGPYRVGDAAAAPPPPDTLPATS